MLSLSTLVVFKEAEFAPCTVSVRANAEQMRTPIVIRVMWQPSPR